ncbi:MAG: M23 family metallopeptidase [Actinomycetes bacterium]|nr:M23 family metallopeptidase [Actinomycetes bacterium]
MALLSLCCLFGCLFGVLPVSTGSFVGVPTAAAATVTHPQILLGFEQRYGDANKKHLGVDVAAVAGADVHAPVAGTVSFIGRVPGSAGLNVTALTITDASGRQICVNPLASTAVKKGDTVSKHQVVGTLAATGDPSVDACHFHLSLRVDGKYRDPSGLLEDVMEPAGLAVAGQADAGATGTDAGPAAAAGVVEAPAAAGAPNAVGTTVARTVSSGQHSGEGAAQKRTEARTAAAPAAAAAGVGVAELSGKPAVRPIGVGQQKHAGADIPLPPLSPLHQGVVGTVLSAAGAMKLRATDAHASERAGVTGAESAGESDAVGNVGATWYNSLISTYGPLQIAGMLFAAAVVLSCAGYGVFVLARGVICASDANDGTMASHASCSGQSLL